MKLPSSSPVLGVLLEAGSAGDSLDFAEVAERDLVSGAALWGREETDSSPSLHINLRVYLRYTAGGS